MPEDVYSTIMQCAETLNIAPYVEGIPRFILDNNLAEADLYNLAQVFIHMAERKNSAVIDTLLRMSRLPLKVPKSFENFDFSRIHGKNVEKLTALSSLAAIQAHCNLAFIGPPGVGKTHLAMAYGRACCEKGMKSYFLKASELNQKFTEARRMDRVGSTVNFLVKPSCLIIDEIGRCKFDKENTHLFFDLIDRRYGKEGPNCMIFTSNKQPDPGRSISPKIPPCSVHWTESLMKPLCLSSKVTAFVVRRLRLSALRLAHPQQRQRKAVML